MNNHIIYEDNSEDDSRASIIFYEKIEDLTNHEIEPQTRELHLEDRASDASMKIINQSESDSSDSLSSYDDNIDESPFNILYQSDIDVRNISSTDEETAKIMESENSCIKNIDEVDEDSIVTNSCSTPKTNLSDDDITNNVEPENKHAINIDEDNVDSSATSSSSTHKSFLSEDNHISKEDAFIFYRNEMDKLSCIYTVEEGNLWLKNIKQSHYFGCLKGMITEDEMSNMTISEIGILVTKIVPSFGSQATLCCHPGCNYTGIASSRRAHWDKCHGNCGNEIPQYDLVHVAFAVAGKFTRFQRVSSGTNDEEIIKDPILMCPICNEDFFTTNQKAWTSHITSKHKQLGVKIKSLGRFWGLESYNYLNGRRTSLASYMRSFNAKSCPYCEFCANNHLQVIMHINGIHKEHQNNLGKCSIDSHYKIILTDEFTKQSQRAHIKHEVSRVIEAPEDQKNVNFAAENVELMTNEGQTEEETSTDNSPDIEMSEFKKALSWSRELRHHQASIPRLRLKTRAKLKAPISNFIKDTAIPLLRKFLNTRRGDSDNERWQAMDGVISYIEYEMTKVVIDTLGIRGDRKRSNNTEEVNEREVEFAQISHCRDAAAKSAALLNSIFIESLNSEDSDQVRDNKIYSLKDRCIYQLKQVDDEVINNVFHCNSSEVTGKEIDDLINEGQERFMSKITYLSNAFEEKLSECTEKRRKYKERKVQELYSEDPKRALRWYVDRKASPNCPIDIEEVRSNLAARWQPNLSYEKPSVEDQLWRSYFQFSDSENELLEKEITSKEHFMSIIQNRNPQSANGPDGIGYGILKLDLESASTMMSLISKALLKYHKMPSLWNRGRTILLYKDGNANDIDNWRPLTIAPCMYRVWTAAVASTLQSINRQRPIFHRSQKGFIKGIDGCLEHTQMITELFNDANRNKKDIYTLTIDLKDAFGSLPHEYIYEVLEETNLSTDIREVIKDSYNKGTTVVNLDKLDSSEIRIRKGVKQGCPLSPLIFNLCINPLLKALQDSNKGYRVKDKVVSVQAYADDIILFSDSRRGLECLIDIVERFIAYSKLCINVSKCHSLAYIINESGRVTDLNPFMINNNPIPLENLSESIEYLGSAAAATVCIRYKGTEEVIEESKILIDKIMKSQLKVNQKLDAIRRFVIPSMDYLLTEGNPRKGDLEDIDRKIRVGIAHHVGVPSFPISFTQTHWKDGGLSLQPLYIRGSVLKIKKFIALYNSPNIQTRILFRSFTDSERKFRGVKKVENTEESAFIDWETNSEGKIVSKRSGTSSLSGTVNKECQKLNVRITLDEDKACLIIKTNDGEVRIDSPKLVSKVLMIRNAEKARMELIQQGMHGHSFINLRNAIDSNYLLGNYTNKVSDKVITFLMAARTNTLYTGYISHLNGKDNGPKCPYCGAKGEKDTLFHRLNNCTPAKYMYTYRHNLVAQALVKQLQVRYPESTIRQNQTVRINGFAPLTTEEGKLKPDIIVITPKEIHIVEISCPYDTPKEEGTTALDITYNTKKNKYEELRSQCEEHFGRKCKLYIVIVSSLGAIHKNTVTDIKKLLKIKRDNRSLKYITRRLTTAAIIGSFLTFNKVNIRRNGGQNGATVSISNEEIGDVSQEENTIPENLLV